jgi:hypothetical protein
LRADFDQGTILASKMPNTAILSGHFLGATGVKG